MFIAGVDIGNSTTEVCIGRLAANGHIDFVASGEVMTTGTKGDIGNIKGIKEALSNALTEAGLTMNDLSGIRLNEAAPVIGHTAMETISETIMTESTMIGHNPDTPAGAGLAIGLTLSLEGLKKLEEERKIDTTPYLLLIPETLDYEKAAALINATACQIAGVIAKNDEAVLIYNRLNKKVPIVDEVMGIEKIPLWTEAALEVAYEGTTIHQLSNPFGLAKVFNLSAKETRQVIPIAKSLIGKKSGIVIKSKDGRVEERVLHAGAITLTSMSNETVTIQIDAGAEAIMEKVKALTPIRRICGEANTQIGDMLGATPFDVKDLLALDTFVPMRVKGALSGEVAMEKAVAIAAMVNTHALPMKEMAQRLETMTQIPVKVAGVEAVMATLGAMTTRGTQLPLAILDLGGGSTDAAVIDGSGRIVSTHLAGAGSFITLLLDKELCLNNLALAELIKRYPLGTVQSLHHITMENGDVKFFEYPLDPKFFAKVVIIKGRE